MRISDSGKARRFQGWATHLMKVVTAPFGSLFSSMAVKDAEKALAMHTCKVVHKGMRVFHGTAPPLVAVLRYAYAERKRSLMRPIGKRERRMLIEDL